MRLVIEYTVSDGCTYSATNTLPIEYESAEAALIDFESMATELMAKSRETGDFSNLHFGGQEFVVYDFYEDGKFYAPTILTVDEWFNRIL